MAVDTEIEIKVDGLVRIATANKQRDMENGTKAAFSLEVVQVGVDGDLDPITSCVVQTPEIPNHSQTSRKRLSGIMQMAHQALQDALKANGRKMGDKETFPISRDVVEVDVWRHKFQRRREADEINKQSVVKSFNRQRRDLQEHNYTRQINEYV